MVFLHCKYKLESGEDDEGDDKKHIFLEGRDKMKSPLNTSEEKDEEKGKKGKLLENRDEENFQLKRRWKELVFKRNWRSLALVSVLCVAQLLMFSAYSLIAPFFPSAV